MPIVSVIYSDINVTLPSSSGVLLMPLVNSTSVSEKDEGGKGHIPLGRKRVLGRGMDGSCSAEYQNRLSVFTLFY